MQSSEGLIKLIKIIETKNITIGAIHKNVLDLYLKSENIPVMWKKHYMKIANDRNGQYVRRKKSKQHCYEFHFFINNHLNIFVFL